MIIIGTSLMWNENPFNLQDEALSKFKFVSDKNGQPPTTATLSTDLLDLVPDFTNPFSARLTDKHAQNAYNQQLNFRAHARKTPCASNFCPRAQNACNQQFNLRTHARKTPSASNFCPRALAYRTATDICMYEIVLCLVCPRTYEHSRR